MYCGLVSRVWEQIAVQLWVLITFLLLAKWTHYNSQVLILKQLDLQESDFFLMKLNNFTNK